MIKRIAIGLEWPLCTMQVHTVHVEGHGPGAKKHHNRIHDGWANNI